MGPVKDWDASVLLPTYAFNVQFHQVRKPALRSAFHLEGTGIGHNMSSSNYRHVSRQLGVIQTFATSAQSEAARKTGKLKPPTNTGNLKKESSQTCTVRTGICFRKLRVQRTTTTLSPPSERLAVNGYRKLLARQLSPYRVISAGLEYVRISQTGSKTRRPSTVWPGRRVWPEKRTETLPTKHEGQTMKTSLTSPKTNQIRISGQSNSRPYEIREWNYATPCDGIARNMPTILTNARHTLRWTLSTVTGREMQSENTAKNH